MEKLEAIQEDHWYLLYDVMKVVKDLLKICKGLQESRETILSLFQQGEPPSEHLNKPLVTLNYLVTRVEDNSIKLVYLIRQLILMFDQVMLLMHDNLKEEHTAVQDMLNKMAEPYRHSLSDNTKHLVKKKEKPREHGTAASV